MLTEFGGLPVYADFPVPTPGDGQVVLDVVAAGVHHVDLLKASGTFYLDPPPLPSVLGTDGVGRAADGRRYYFDGCVAPYGSWAQSTLVPQVNLFEPADGVDDQTAAALGNTGMAAWLALAWRAALQPGESVLVLGANGALGSVAVTAAKLLGAGTVVAADRNATRLRRALERGADATVALDEPDLPGALRAASGPEGRGFDAIVDPLWGPCAVAAMAAAAHRARYVQLGHRAGAIIELPATAVRSAALDVMGFATFHAPLDVRRDAYRQLTAHAAAGRLRIDVEAVALADVETAWQRQQRGAGTKLVLLP